MPAYRRLNRSDIAILNSSLFTCLDRMDESSLFVIGAIRQQQTGTITGKDTALQS